MRSSTFLFVLSRQATSQEFSAAALGELTGRMMAWVGALRSWQLLDAIAIGPPSDAGPFRGFLLVSASDLTAAQRLAATRPVGTGSAITVVPLHEVVREP